jgi:hypothetical protein
VHPERHILGHELPQPHGGIIQCFGISSTTGIFQTQAVNMNIAQEMKQLKSKVRIGLKELQEKGYLAKYEITRDNRVRVSKTKDAAIKFESQILGNTHIEFFVG